MQYSVLQSLLRLYPDGGMELYRIPDLMNRPRTITPELIQPCLDGM